MSRRRNSTVLVLAICIAFLLWLQNGCTTLIAEAAAAGKICDMNNQAADQDCLLKAWTSHGHWCPVSANKSAPGGSLPFKAAAVKALAWCTACEDLDEEVAASGTFVRFNAVESFQDVVSEISDVSGLKYNISVIAPQQYVAQRYQFTEVLPSPENPGPFDFWFLKSEVFGVPETNDAFLDTTLLLLNDPEYKAAEIPTLWRAAMSSASVSGGKYMSVPLSVIPVFFYYRKDLFEKYDLTPPQTWDEMLDIAAAYGCKDLDNDGLLEYGICSDMTSACGIEYEFVYTVASTIVQLKNQSDGFLFDPTNLNLLLQGDVLKETMRIFQGIRRHSFPEDTPCFSWFNTYFLQGKCLMTIGFPTAFKLSSHTQKSSKAIYGQIGVSQLPGSEKVLDRSTGQLVPCTKDLCPHAIPVTRPSGEQVLVNKVPIITAFSYAINRHAPLYRQAAAFNLLSTALGPHYHKKMVLAAESEISPIRESELVLEEWVAAGYNATLTAPFLNEYRWMLWRCNLYSEPTFPGMFQYKDVLQAYIHTVNANKKNLSLWDAAEAAYMRGVQEMLRSQGGAGAILPLYRKALGLEDHSMKLPAPHNPPSSEPTSNQRITIIAACVGALGLCLLAAAVLMFLKFHWSREFGSHRVVAPPAGMVVLCVTDIQDSTVLWETLPAEVCQAALQLHHATIRKCANTHNGYESATEGDSFILAFYNTTDCTRFALQLQSTFLECDWPQELLESDLAGCVTVYGSGDAAGCTSVGAGGERAPGRSTSGCTTRRGTGLPDWSRGSLLLGLQGLLARTKTGLRSGSGGAETLCRDITVRPSAGKLDGAKRLSAGTAKQGSITTGQLEFPKGRGLGLLSYSTSSYSVGNLLIATGSGRTDDALLSGAAQGTLPPHHHHHLLSFGLPVRASNEPQPRQTSTSYDGRPQGAVRPSCGGRSRLGLQDFNFSQVGGLSPDVRTAPSTSATMAGAATAVTKSLAPVEDRSLRLSNEFESAPPIVTLTLDSNHRMHDTPAVERDLGFRAQHPTNPNPHGQAHHQLPPPSLALRMTPVTPSSSWRPSCSRDESFQASDGDRRLVTGGGYEDTMGDERPPALSSSREGAQQRVLRDVLTPCWSLASRGRERGSSLQQCRRRLDLQRPEVSLHSPVDLGGSSNHHTNISSNNVDGRCSNANIVSSKNTLPISPSLDNGQVHALSNTCSSVSLGDREAGASLQGQSPDGREGRTQHGPADPSAVAGEPSFLDRERERLRRRRTDSGAFMRGSKQAMHFSLPGAEREGGEQTQMLLQDLLSLVFPAVTGNSGAPTKAAKEQIDIFRGLRVRVGFHYGIVTESEVQFNRASQRTVYSGPVLQLAKAVSDAGRGGQITLSAAAHQALDVGLLAAEAAMVLYGGCHVLKEGQLGVEVYSLFSKVLVARAAHLLPLRSLDTLVPGTLAAPLGFVTVASLQLVEVGDLAQADGLWGVDTPPLGPAVAEAVRAKALRLCKKHRGYMPVAAGQGSASGLQAVFLDGQSAIRWLLDLQRDLEVGLVVGTRGANDEDDAGRADDKESATPTRLVMRAGVDVGSPQANLTPDGRVVYDGLSCKVANRLASVAGWREVLVTFPAVEAALREGNPQLAALRALLSQLLSTGCAADHAEARTCSGSEPCGPLRHAFTQSTPTTPALGSTGGRRRRGAGRGAVLRGPSAGLLPYKRVSSSGQACLSPVTRSGSMNLRMGFARPSIGDDDLDGRPSAKAAAATHPGESIAGTGFPRGTEGISGCTSQGGWAGRVLQQRSSTARGSRVLQHSSSSFGPSWRAQSGGSSAVHQHLDQEGPGLTTGPSSGSDPWAARSDASSSSRHVRIQTLLNLVTGRPAPKRLPSRLVLGGDPHDSQQASGRSVMSHWSPGQGQGQGQGPPASSMRNALVPPPPGAVTTAYTCAVVTATQTPAEGQSGSDPTASFLSPFRSFNAGPDAAGANSGTGVGTSAVHAEPYQSQLALVGSPTTHHELLGQTQRCWQPSGMLQLRPSLLRSLAQGAGLGTSKSRRGGWSQGGCTTGIESRPGSEAGEDCLSQLSSRQPSQHQPSPTATLAAVVTTARQQPHDGSEEGLVGGGSSNGTRASGGEGGLDGGGRGCLSREVRAAAELTSPEGGTVSSSELQPCGMAAMFEMLPDGVALMKGGAPSVRDGRNAHASTGGSTAGEETDPGAAAPTAASVDACGLQDVRHGEQWAGSKSPAGALGEDPSVNTMSVSALALRQRITAPSRLGLSPEAGGGPGRKAPTGPLPSTEIDEEAYLDSPLSPVGTPSQAHGSRCTGSEAPARSDNRGGTVSHAGSRLSTPGDVIPAPPVPPLSAPPSDNGAAQPKPGLRGLQGCPAGCVLDTQLVFTDLRVVAFKKARIAVCRVCYP